MKEREKLSSRLGFILLSAGCAIGLGNVWRFPYITGQYGGAAFVLIYLVFLALLGLPVMTMEFAIGRAGKQNLIGCYRTLEKKGTKWHLSGGFGVIGNYVLLMFYTAISGWLFYYFISSLTGKFGPSASNIGGYFGDMIGNPVKQTIFMLIALTFTALIVGRGVQKGVEKITKVMMIVLFGMMVALAIYACTLPNASAGLKFYLLPDFSKLVDSGLFNSIFAAMGQSFFTLSLGIGSMAIFGSYLSDERSLTGEVVRIISLDTSIALLAGLIIFPACFAYNVEAGAGPSLLFISLPEVFSKMNGGVFWGTIFFLAMFFAALSTLVAVFENIVAYWIDIRKMDRKKAVILNFILIGVGSLPCILGFNVLSGVQPLGAGTGILDLEDFIVSNLLLPLGSLTMAIFCSWKIGWGWDNFIAEADKGTGLKFPKWLKGYCKYILPLIIIFVFVAGIITFFA